MLFNFKETSCERRLLVMCTSRHPAPTLTRLGTLPSAARCKCRTHHPVHGQTLTRRADSERTLPQTVTRCASSLPRLDRRLLLEACTLQVLTANCGHAVGVEQSPSRGRTGAGPSEPVGDGIETIRQAYDTYAGAYDQLDGGLVAEALGFTQLRRELLAQATGMVLEVGVGTGLNLPLYDPSRVSSITALDLSEGMLQQAKGRGRSLSTPVSFVQGDVTSMPFDSGQFDSVVDTFSLCVFPEPLAAVREMGRVLKPGGRALLLEHCRSSFAPLAWYQDLTADVVAKTGKACVWNQDVVGIVKEAGLHIKAARPALGGLLVLLEAST